MPENTRNGVTPTVVDFVGRGARSTEAAPQRPGLLGYRWRAHYESATRQWQVVGHVPGWPTPSFVMQVKHKPGDVDGARVAGVFARLANDFEDGAELLLAASDAEQAETEAAASGAPHAPRTDPDTGQELEAVWLPRHLVRALNLFEADAERARTALELRSLADDLDDEELMTPETTRELATAIRSRADQVAVKPS